MNSKDPVFLYLLTRTYRIMRARGAMQVDVQVKVNGKCTPPVLPREARVLLRVPEAVGGVQTPLDELFGIQVGLPYLRTDTP